MIEQNKQQSKICLSKVILFALIFIIPFVFHSGKAKAECTSWSVWAESQSGSYSVPFNGCADNKNNDGSYVKYRPGDAIFTSGGGGNVRQSSSCSCIGLYSQIEPYGGTLAYLISPVCRCDWAFVGAIGVASLVVPNSPGSHYLQFNGCVLGYDQGCVRTGWSSPIYFEVWPKPPQITSFYPSPQYVTAGSYSDFVWTTLDTAYVYFSGYGGVIWAPNYSYRMWFSTPGTYSYYLRAYNSWGEYTEPLSWASVYVGPGSFGMISANSECDGSNPVNRISWNASQSALYYRIYRNGDYIGYSYTTSYIDYNISYGGSYTYQAKAFNVYETPSNNTITLGALYCSQPHVTILPSLSSILAGQSQTLAWTGTNVDRVDILNYGNVYTGGIGSPSGTITVAPKETTTYTIKGYNPSSHPSASASATVYVGNLGMSGGGDIYSGNVLSDAGGKIQFDKRSVLSAADANGVKVFDDAYYPWKIPDYDSVIWGITKEKMQKNRDNLVGSAANISSGSYSGVWYLDSDSTNPNVGPRNTSKYPDGKVWHVNGDLTLDNVTFVGKGTIIVDGKVNITGSVAYSNDGNQNTYSVGIIANGNIDIEQNVDYVAGAYFTFATINIK